MRNYCNSYLADIQNKIKKSEVIQQKLPKLLAEKTPLASDSESHFLIILLSFLQAKFRTRAFNTQLTCFKMAFLIASAH